MYRSKGEGTKGQDTGQGTGDTRQGTKGAKVVEVVRVAGWYTYNQNYKVPR